MDRLTKRDKYGYWYTDTVIYDRGMTTRDGIHYEKDNSINAYDGEPIDKLAEYEDVEENGRLVKFPCAIGSTVYIPVTHYYFGLKKINEKKVLQATAEKIEISESGIKVITRNGSGIREFSPSDFWKTIFTDREQAKQALQKMKQEQ